ncbi:uncharacterized protein LOC144908413 [Branchiostoma floridae x Branchiostoma belcheri]
MIVKVPFLVGSPVSPIVANLFMEHFEEVAISTAPNPLKFWGRYVDDTFVIQKKDRIEEFTAHINQVNSAIKFTVEREKEGKLPMLDTLIHRRPDGSLYATIYRKPTHTDLYLNFSSHHPLQHKIGVVRTLTDRANVIVTEESDKTLEIEHIQNALSVCGYPEWMFQACKTKRCKRPNRTPPDQTRVVRRGTVSIPYIKGISETLMRLYRSKGIQCQFRPVNTIRRNLVAPKDKIKTLDRSGTVYHIPCADCPATYVGESERPLRARLQEHKRPSCVSSPVVEHVARKKHNIDWDRGTWAATLCWGAMARVVDSSSAVRGGTGSGCWAGLEEVPKGQQEGGVRAGPRVRWVGVGSRVRAEGGDSRVQQDDWVR